MEKQNQFNFKVEKQLEGTLARTGEIVTPHGKIKTPAFIPVGTKATLKALTPEQLSELGSQAVLVNAYHLYLQPGHDVIDKAGGAHQFMHWDKPMFSDSGGFQVMSLGVGFKKVIDMTMGNTTSGSKKSSLAWIDDNGVTFKSHITGDKHRFTPELAMQIQHGIGADITFAFDELTTLHHSKEYQIESLKKRTHPWALASLREHQRLTKLRADKPYQALFGVIQGAQYEDLRRQSARFMAGLDFDGFGLGGAYTKEGLGEIIGWMNEELPEEKPRHLLGISEPNDIFIAIENGVDTFDCVSPARVGRNGALYTPAGRINVTNRKYNDDFKAVDEKCDCYTCQNYSRAYLNHLFRSKELLAFTLATIHNERFIVKLVNDTRESIVDGTFFAFKKHWLSLYYGTSS